MNTFDNIDKYVKLLPESMQIDSRNKMYDILDRILKDTADLNRIERYANNPTKDSSVAELEQALYDHERPYYHYCASGGGNDPSESQVWRFERNRLNALLTIKNGSLNRMENSGWAKKSKTMRQMISNINWFK